MSIGSALGLASLLGVAFAPGVAVLWIAAIAAGAASASIDVGIAAVVSDHTPLASRAAAMAGWNAITGARGIAAAFVMSALLQVGIVDVTSGLLLCAVATGIGVVLYARAGTGQAKVMRAAAASGVPAMPDARPATMTAVGRSSAARP